VVLDHVADDACFLVVTAALLDPDFLGHRDLDMGDRIAVPDTFVQRVREPEHQKVLNGLLAEIVIDAEDATLVEDLVNLLGQRACARESWPNGFSMTIRRSSARGHSAIRSMIRGTPTAASRRNRACRPCRCLLRRC